MGYCSKCIDKYGKGMYVLFRVLIGLMFFLHGWDKIVAKGMPIGSLFGVAGVIELVVGLGIFFGVWTRLAALGGAVQMLVAYIMKHASGGLSPLVTEEN